MLLGNDIVDLQEARKTSNWQRPRYLEKIFTPKEQAWIQQANQADRWVWMLWSAKESAYKLSRQLGAERAYAPKRLEIRDWTQEDATNYRLQVLTEQAELTVHTTLSHTFVHSVALIDENANWQAEILNLSGTHGEQRKQLREQVCKCVAEADSRVGVEIYRIVKNESEIPQLWLGETKLDIVLSLSHHGRYGAYCWGRS